MNPKYTVLGDKDWLAKRNEVITATEVGSLFGLNPFKSASQISRDKKENNFKANAYTLVGNWAEPCVVNLANYYLNTDFKLMESDAGKIFYTLDDVKLGATPDAEGPLGLLECKTTGPVNVVKWKYNPPLYYVMQVYVQMLCTQIDTGYLVGIDLNMAPKNPQDMPNTFFFKYNKDEWVFNAIKQEVNRYWDCIDNNKQFRVDSKIKNTMRLRLLYNMEIIDESK